MGEAFFNAAFEEDLRTRNARSSVSELRELSDDMIVFNCDGKIFALRSERGLLREGDHISDYMVKDEWRYVWENSNRFDCERIIVDTKFGAMLIYCNLLASMQIMIGLIFHGDRKALVSQYMERGGALTRISPRLRPLCDKRRVPADDMARARELVSLASRAFSVAGVKERLLRSPQEATAYLIDRGCRIAEAVGCCLDFRSARSSVPNLQNFSMQAYVAMVTGLLLFARETCPSRSVEMKMGDIGGGLCPVLRCEPCLGEDGLVVNRRYRHGALRLCSGMAAARVLLFECSMREDADGPHLLVRFFPSLKPLERLGVKKPPDRLDYSDMPKFDEGFSAEKK